MRRILWPGWPSQIYSAGTLLMAMIGAAVTFADLGSDGDVFLFACVVGVAWSCLNLTSRIVLTDAGVVVWNQLHRSVLMWDDIVRFEVVEAELSFSQRFSFVRPKLNLKIEFEDGAGEVIQPYASRCSFYVSSPSEVSVPTHIERKIDAIQTFWAVHRNR